MNMYDKLYEFKLSSAKLYESYDFACGYLEAMILEMYKKLSKEDQDVYLRVITEQNAKITKELGYKLIKE
jgi:hypothetical protein